ncbi:MAG: carbohydrate-binding protein [Cytophagaceae bacterium]|nr:carbohydrate-binding protein [Cytophagaceae bacterium]
MRKHLYYWRVFVALILFLIPSLSYAQLKVVAYAASWSVVPAEVQYDKLTHINYSFIRPTTTGGLTGVDQAWKLQELVTRGHARGVKIGIAIGGWSNLNNTDFQVMAGNASYRAAFVTNVNNFLNQYNLDGVDIDWEFPKDGNDPQNFSLLMRDLAASLRPRGKFVSAAVQPQPYYGSGILNSVFPNVDILNLMIYDLGGSNHSSWQATVEAIDYWTGRGCPASKLTLGVPFYSRPNENTFKALIAQGANPYSDSFNGNSYNGITTIKAKTNLAYDRGVGGMMIWEISHDAVGANSLVTAMHQVKLERENVNIPQSPYGGTARAIPGKIEAEHYDLGGQGVSYSDASTANEGGAFRTDAVDVQATTDTDGGFNIGYTVDGEWLEYSVNVAATGAYNLAFRTASTVGGTVRLEMDGADVTGAVALPVTGGWQTWATTMRNNVSLTAGVHIMRLFVVTGGFNINHLTITAVPVVQGPYNNAIGAIPGKIEAENFDTGGQNVAYNDSDASNNGGQYRTSERVDIEASTDAGAGFNIGYTSAGEWLEYTVNIASAGTYTLQARVASINTGKSFHVEVDGVNISGAVNVPNTTAWQTWQTVSVTTTPLTTGQKIMRIVMDTDGFNLNFLNFVLNPQAPVISSASTASATAGVAFSYTITASNNPTSFSATGLPAGLAVNTTTGVITGAPAAVGTYTITLGASNAGGTASKALSLTVAPNQTPYTGTAINLPGKIEAENYDLGGQTIAYYDVTAANEGNAYRTESVDIETTTDEGGGFNIGYTADGEWLEYTTNVTAAGTYNVAFRTASTSGGVLRMEVDGADATGSVTLPNTGGWQTWTTTTKANVALTAGQHVVRLFIVTGGFNLNSITVTVPGPVQTPFNNVVVSLPGKIEAENYDLGGQGVAFNDSSPTNEGSAYRTDAVDIQATTDAGGGYNIGYTTDGEWLEYTVNVTTSRTYDVAFRTASTLGGTIRLEVDGVDATGAVALPNTGGWQNWATTTKTNVAFTAGQHIVRVFIVTGGFNLNAVTVSVPVPNNGFLRASGRNIVNNNGNYVLKTVNLGNWMVQEGYMLNLGGGYQWNIKNKIADVVGVAARDKFYNDYLANFITKADIDSLAKWGFNSVRLPMHYNLFTPLGQPDTYFESGFVHVDNVIRWCKANNMYVILDLHAAPGGQSSGDISDYVAGQPSLWESAANRAQTVKLWRKFAERYANETTVGGYDLINETNWTLPNNNALLMQLMKDITAAIRQVDNNHLVIIEGNSYANDYNGLTPKWDNNMAYSFHKYWNDVNDGSIGFALAIRDGQNVPIYLGEFGENSNHWIAETVSLMNRHNIGWAIWPYKKMSTLSAIGSFKEPNNWYALANYINGGAKPSAATGQAILNELIENIKSANMKVNKDYLYALINASNNETAPYAANRLPGRVQAAHFDMGKNGQAYSDAVHQTAQFGSGGGSFVAWNTGYYLRNDGVDIQYSAAENAPTVGWTETNEWIQYTVNATTSGSYAVRVRVAGNGGRLTLSSDGVTVLNSITIPATGGWDSWQTVTLGNVNLSAGTHKLRMTFAAAGLNVSYLEFTNGAAIVPGAAFAAEEQQATAVSNAPNPFTATTAITIEMVESADASVKVFDKTGTVIATLVDGYLEKGSHTYTFDGSTLNADVYYVQCISGDKVTSRKIMKIY